MTLEQLKEIYMEKLVIQAIDTVNDPVLLFHRERPVVKKALLKYLELIEAEVRNQKEGESDA